MNESEATFRPTCFIHTNDRSPEAAAAAATSRATFSLVENSKYIPASLATSMKTSPISEEGVPGYVAATEMPFSRAPLTTASFPNKYNLVPGCAVNISLISLIPPCQLRVISMNTTSHCTTIVPVLSAYPRSSEDIFCIRDYRSRHTCVCRLLCWLLAFGLSQFGVLSVLPGNLSRCNDQNRQDENRNAKVCKGSISLFHNCHEPKVRYCPRENDPDDGPDPESEFVIRPSTAFLCPFLACCRPSLCGGVDHRHGSGNQGEEEHEMIENRENGRHLVNDGKGWASVLENCGIVASKHKNHRNQHATIQKESKDTSHDRLLVCLQDRASIDIGADAAHLETCIGQHIPSGTLEERRCKHVLHGNAAKMRSDLR